MPLRRTHSQHPAGAGGGAVARAAAATQQQQQTARPPATTTASTQQQQQQQQQQAGGWAELHRAAQIAAWSGLCYLTAAELPAAIQQQHGGSLTLLASGRNEYTAWFVADGVVPAARFCNTIASRSRTHGGSSGNGSSGSDGLGGGSSTAGVCTQVPQGTRERYVFFRGVQWEFNNSEMSRALWSIWPTRFPSRAINGGGSGPGKQQQQQQQQQGSPLVAHAGVAGIAEVRSA
jgi:hypothetical protein